MRYRLPWICKVRFKVNGTVKRALMRAHLLSLTKNIDEISQLARTLDITIEMEFFQSRRVPDAKTFMGKGKIEIIRDHLGENPCDIVLVNHDLTPAQNFNLNRSLGTHVWDRIRLILEIFKRNAQSQEAQLQVELAGLRYEVPIQREYIHRSKMGERAGFSAGGEFPTAYHLERTRRRIRKIHSKLDKFVDIRERRREGRKKGGFSLVSLAGYTNAGKSCLLRALTGEEVIVDEKLFSTLSVTTRRIGMKRQVLVSDTVGFIEGLPVWLVNAFRSTLEEVFQADLILLVIDLSEPTRTIKAKMETCLDILWSKDQATRILVVPNKIDLVSQEEMESRTLALQEDDPGSQLMNWCPVSAMNGTWIPRLIEEIHKALPSMTQLRVFLPNTDAARSFLSWLIEHTVVWEVHEGCTKDFLSKGVRNPIPSNGGDTGIGVILESSPEHLGVINTRCEDASGKCQLIPSDHDEGF